MKATQQLTATLGNITKQLSMAESMDSLRVCHRHVLPPFLIPSALDIQKVSTVMEQFEKKFEDMEVAADVMDKSMNSVTSNMAAQDDVDSLIRQVADEYSLELKVLLPEIGQRDGAYFPRLPDCLVIDRGKKDLIHVSA
jgi:hypothetical protein